MAIKKLVVIGGDAAGMSAASKVRRIHKTWKIIVFERGRYTSYAACGMPYFIEGIVESADQLIARTPEVFREKQNIDVRILHEVIQIDPDKKRVRVRNLEEGSEFWESYDDLLIATGASPVRPAVAGIDAKGIFGLSILQSGLDVFTYMREHKPQKAVIVGGGYIGIEMAEALLERNMKVSLVDMASEVMITMDPDMGKLISEYMREKGVDLYMGEKLDHFETRRGKITGIVTDKRTLGADLVILGMGAVPNTSLAKEAGLELGAKDAIRINKKMETSVANIWAAGDCAESFHLVSEKQVHIALGTVANKQGLIAGENISGGSMEFPGVVGTAITKIKELEISRTGLNEKELNDLGIPYKSSTITSSTLPGYYPGAGEITVKLLAEKTGGRLLGGQIVGKQGAAKRIDILAIAITARMTLSDLLVLDLSYAPPFSPVWDPLQIAARDLLIGE
jgi:NADPH-dependent 2,4-dienoyl-CoA reductase/sulfur reductase-like enzyme